MTDILNTAAEIPLTQWLILAAIVAVLIASGLTLNHFLYKPMKDLDNEGI